jgi:phage gp45-like
MAGPDETFEHVMQLRGQAVRGLVHAVNDNGGKQTVDVETHSGRLLSGVPVYQPFGFGSVAPAEGAVTIVIAAGGDQGDPMALMPENPGAARFGKLNPGESVQYDAAGNRLHFRNGVLAHLVAVQVTILTQVLTITSEQPATINVPEGLTIVGNVTIDGNLIMSGDGVSAGNVSAENVTAAGQVTDHKSSMDGIREIYNDHTNPPGGTDVPPQQM